MRQRFFFTQCEKISFKAFLTIIIYYRKKKATATRRVQGGNYREAREVPPARSLRCSAKSQRQKPAVQCEKPTHLTPCLVHTHGVCLAFRRLAVHCAHLRSVPACTVVRCLTLQVQGTVQVATVCAAARRCRASGDSVRCSAKMPAVARRLPRRGARHRASGHSVRCNAKMPAVARRLSRHGARHRASGHSVRCNAKMPAVARRLPRHGARHRASGNSVRCNAKMPAVARRLPRYGARHRASGHSVRCSAKMPAVARRLSRRGAIHCASGDSVRCSAKMPAVARRLPRRISFPGSCDYIAYRLIKQFEHRRRQKPTGDPLRPQLRRTAWWAERVRVR